MIGRIIGTYKIVEKLGEGGMGAVYKGVDTMLDREVAIKALKPELASQTSIVERFRSEAVTLAKLHHPNIATLYSLFREGDELYMVLEYVRGETLDALLTRRGALPTEEVIPVFCQILDGINHAHDFGIIHRDIKPANMMLTETGQLKVLDFGIARLLGSNRMTRAGNIIGTLEYMAPEQVKGLETDARSDTYALGMMLYEVLTGRTPFNTDNEFELMKMQTEVMPPNPRSINASIPESVETAIMTSIQKDPDARFQTAGDFREFLLDAGFMERGSLRRTTGPRRAATAPPVAAPISKPEIFLDTRPSGDGELKETRLGASVAAPVYAADMKETRLGGAPAMFSSEPVYEEQPSGSFFDRLTWVHYAAGGTAAAMVLGFIIIVPLVIFSGIFSSSSSANSNSALSNSNTANMAGQQPIQTPAFSTPLPPLEREPVAVAPTPEPIATEEPKPVERSKTEPIDKKPPTPRRTPKPVDTRSEDEKVRCALTGDCKK